MVRIDVARVSDIDNDGATLMMRALAALKKAKKEVLFGSPEHLSAIISARIEPGKRENEAIWLLLLQLLQQTYQQEAFDEAAVNYAITFEVSPPSFEAPPANRQPAVAEAQPVTVVSPLSLRGQLLGAGPGEFVALANAAKALPVADAGGEGRVDISALGLVRIDQKSLDALMPVLSEINDSGRRVNINGLSQLVAGYLASHGVAQMAELRTRRA
jgi:ABC-type transporter Mla MlaB component